MDGQHWLSIGLSIVSMLITVSIFMFKLNKTLQNGINQRLRVLEEQSSKHGTDLKWIKDRMHDLPCVRDPKSYFKEN